MRLPLMFFENIRGFYLDLFLYEISLWGMILPLMLLENIRVLLLLFFLFND